MAIVDFRDAFYGWYAQFLKDRGLQFTRMGSKASFNTKHAVDAATGYWIDPNYSGSKPIRWLLHIDPFSTPVRATVPNGHLANRVGHSNTAQGDKAGIAVRVIPVVAQGGGSFTAKEGWEMTLVFSFAGPVAVGSAAETFDFEPTTGILTYRGQSQTYIHAALLSMVARPETAQLGAKSLTFGEVIDAAQALIHVQPDGLALTPIPVYDLTSQTDLTRLQSDVAKAYANVPAPVAKSGTATLADDDEDVGGATIVPEVPEDKDLLGIDPSVYRQINAALKSGKRHLMLYGPPGTGKTTLARHVAQVLSPDRWTLVTGSADWTSQDIIGGYQPVGGGEVAFQPGVLLRGFDQPLIIDEMNRCDIDKVLGPMFTVLSGQHTTLPYRLDVADPNSAQYVILAAPKPGAGAHEFYPNPGWRLIATINSIDKSSLYQMSYALTRRFGWIYVDAPSDPAAFIRSYLDLQAGLGSTPAGEIALAKLWTSVNAVRVIGPAPFIDIINAVRSMVDTPQFVGAVSQDMRSAVLDAIDMVLLPMLDGIGSEDAMAIAEAAIAAFGFGGAEADRVRSRLAGLSV